MVKCPKCGEKVTYEEYITHYDTCTGASSSRMGEEKIPVRESGWVISKSFFPTLDKALEENGWIGLGSQKAIEITRLTIETLIEWTKKNEPYATATIKILEDALASLPV